MAEGDSAGTSRGGSQYGSLGSGSLRRKTLSIPDPYAQDSEFELFDPRGLSSKPRRPSTTTKPMTVETIFSQQTQSEEQNEASDVRMMSPTSISSFDQCQSMVMSPGAAEDPPRGRVSTLNHLRIGSGGDFAPSDQASTTMDVDHQRAETPNRPREPSESSSWSGQSRAASFLSAFSPPTPFSIVDPSSSKTNGSLQHLRVFAPDQEGFEIAGYVLGEEIGQGGFGMVRRAHDRHGNTVAVKIVRHSHLQEEDKLDSIRRTGSLRVPRHLVERQRSVTTPVPPPSGNTLEMSSSLHELPVSSNAETTASRRLLEKEIAIWQKLPPHPHILSLLQVVHTNEFSYIFMPLCSTNLYTFVIERSTGRRKSTYGRQSLIGSLSPPPSKPRGLPLTLVKEIFAQVVDGLYALHNEAGITHRDIKLENILLDQDRVWRIADFGLAETAERKARSRSRSRSRARPPVHANTMSSSSSQAAEESALSRTMSLNRAPLVPDSSSAQPAGSLPYSSPEQMRSSVNLRSFAVDVWALGCVLYALVSGVLPFRDDFEPRLRVKILEGSWDVPEQLAPLKEGREDAQAEDKAKILEVLRGCLEKDERRRWTIERVKRSAWLSDSFPAASSIPASSTSDLATATRAVGTPPRGRSSRRSEDSATGLAAIDATTTRVPSRSPSSSFASGSPSSSSRPDGRTRKERSTSRGPFSHYGVDPRTRANEMREHEREERLHRWDRERSAAKYAAAAQQQQHTTSSSAGTPAGTGTTSSSRSSSTSVGLPSTRDNSETRGRSRQRGPNEPY